ncbi:MAG: DUF6312 domain-containing protein [Candidatus Binatia bacterium]|jgi:Family of unknown function (DUF6312)
MGDLIRRVTVIRRRGEDSESVTVYREPRSRRRVSAITEPLEKMARRLVRAQVIFGQEMLRRHDQANRRRRDGWLIEAPATIFQSGRKAYNEARKGIPFRILPKA